MISGVCAERSPKVEAAVSFDLDGALMELELLVTRFRNPIDPGARQWIGENWFRRQSDKCRAEVFSVLSQARKLRLVLKHPAVPWPAKLVAACSLGYLISPIQIIPTFIPVIGQLDDLCVLLIGLKIVRRMTPKGVLAECGYSIDHSLYKRIHSEKT